MKEYWIVCFNMHLVPSFIKKVCSYKRKIFKTTIICSEAHRYSSEGNAMKAASIFHGSVERVYES